MTKMLIIVDVQNDFCEGGALAVEGGKDVAKRIGDYIENYHINYDAVVASKDWHVNPGSHWSDNPDFIDSWPKHCEADSHGAMLNPFIPVIYIDELFYKGEYAAAYSAFDGISHKFEDIFTYARNLGVTEVDIVGIAYDYCVKATALDSVRLGFKTRVLSGYSVAVHNGTLDILDVTYELQEAGVEVV